MENLPNLSKFFTNQTNIYIVLVLLIGLNMFCFPELLNNRDIRLNDMSYLLTPVSIIINV